MNKTDKDKHKNFSFPILPMLGMLQTKCPNTLRKKSQTRDQRTEKSGYSNSQLGLHLLTPSASKINKKEM